MGFVQRKKMLINSGGDTIWLKIKISPREPKLYNFIQYVTNNVYNTHEC